jgi:hypothetical protein
MTDFDDEPLYKLQTNDPLWHGVFGGLYLPNLRDTPIVTSSSAKISVTVG